MKLSVRPKAEPEVNMTSLIDVVLLLLIFFMVSTSFVREAEIKIQLPEADVTAEVAPVTETLEIVVTASGGYAVNQATLVNNRAETLRTAILKSVGDRRDLPVTVRADAEATHQAVVTAMDVAGRLGFVKINIVTMNRPDGG